MAKSAAMKMMVGSTWNAKITEYCAPSGPSTAVMMRGHASLLPSGPNTNPAPTLAKSSRRLIPCPRAMKSCCPGVVLSTSSANSTCRLRPQATVRRSMAARLVDDANAIERITIRPTNDCTFGACAA